MSDEPTYNFWDNLMETDDNAGEYMKSYGEGPGAPTRHHLGSFINEGETVLDIGCGPGHNFDHFMEHGPAISNYKGLDYSIRFVRAANARAAQIAGTSSGPFHLGDVRDPKEPDESWDVVVLQDVLEHTNGYEKPVTEAIRIAKKRVVITFWHLIDMDDPHTNDDGDDGWGAWYDKREWEKFLDSLNIHWLHDQIDANNRVRDFYIIDKGENHGNLS